MFRFNERIKAEKAFQNIFGTKLHPFIEWSVKPTGL